MMEALSRPRSREDFEIAIICALPLELDAITLVIDEFWDSEGDQYGRAPGDLNTYLTGRIGKYNVVLVLLTHMGKRTASSASANIRSSYPRVQLALLVGICGGVPFIGEDKDIFLRLGDVVISKSVVQYDFGRQLPDRFVRKDTVEGNLSKATKDIRGLLGTLETKYGLERLQTRTVHALNQLQVAAGEKNQGAKYKHPGQANDKAYEILRREFPQNEQHGLDSIAHTQTPAIHIGVIASGDTVMKSREHRDRVVKDEGVIAFEMEGAGIWEELPCLIVKGVCDYADVHKDKTWQHFAAAVAASSSKAILEFYVQTDKRPEEMAQMPTGRQLGSSYSGKIVGQDVQQGNEMEVSRPGHYVQEGSLFQGDIQARGSITQGNKATF